MAQAKREVNQEPDVEVIDADTIEDNSTEEDLEEEVIPPVDEEAKPTEEKTEEPEEESTEVVEETTEEEPTESSPGDEEVPPKPVEGETPREKALRLEVSRLRNKGRKEDRDSMLKEATPEAPAPEADKEYEDLKALYTPEEFANVEKLLGFVAKKQGFVKKSESYEGVANTVLDTFLDEHTEYEPQNDVDDARWNAFQRILSSDYNLQNKTPKQMKSIFSKVDRDVKDEFGEVKTPTLNREEVAAKKQKIQSVSHSGGTKSPDKEVKVEIDQDVRSHFKGFDDEDLV